jgi:Flavodoxin
MKSLVLYESMYGNTHVIAKAIGSSLSEAGETVVMPLYQVVDGSLRGVELLVVGGPTHTHGLSRASTRKSAAEAARDADKHLTLEAQGSGRGLRDWFGDVRDVSARGAAFDTRLDMPSVLTGRAGLGIARRLRHHGCHLVAEPESFLVDKSNHLLAGEEDRARRWGAELVELMSTMDLAGRV